MEVDGPVLEVGVFTITNSFKGAYTLAPTNTNTKLQITAEVEPL